jgi:hypothetical protein
MTFTFVMGSLLAILGMAGIFISISKNVWASRFRDSWRWGRGGCGGPISRVGFFLAGISLLLFASAMVNEGFLHLRPMPTFPMLMTAFGILVVAGLYDAFMQWRGRVFPIIDRCPHCHKGMDFRMTGIARD